MAFLCFKKNWVVGTVRPCYCLKASERNRKVREYVGATQGAVRGFHCLISSFATAPAVYILVLDQLLVVKIEIRFFQWVMKITDSLWKWNFGQFANEVINSESF